MQRNQSQAFMRVEQDVSVVPMDFSLGACFPNAGLRGAIWRRTTMEREAPMRVTVADKGFLSSFEGAAVEDPDPHGNGAVLSLPRNVAWAAAFLFCLLVLAILSQLAPVLINPCSLEVMRLLMQLL